MDSGHKAILPPVGRGVHRLPQTLQAQLEYFFGHDLSDVRIDHSSAGQAIVERSGGIACASGNTIYASRYISDPGTVRGQSIIAHEVAHLVQQRVAAQSGITHRPSQSLVEMEAARAAIAWISGAAMAPPLTPDPSPGCRAYGPLGHYYTVYFASLAAGFSDDIAACNAFWCQVPDLVAELDAVACAEAIVSQIAIDVFLLPAVEPWELHLLRAMAPAEIFVAVDATTFGYILGSEVAKHRKQVNAFNAMPLCNITKHDKRMIFAHSQFSPSYEDLWNIQEGLHCLNGNLAAEETKWRMDTARDLQPGSSTLGLALHALGDSFAHRDTGSQNTINTSGVRMYPPPFGHCHLDLGHRDLLWQNYKNPLDEAGSRVDNPNQRPGIYLDYGSRLFELLSAMPGEKRTPLNAGDFQEALRYIAGEQQKESQLDKMKILMSMYQKLGHSQMSFGHSYDPQENSVAWKTFFSDVRNRDDLRHILLPPDFLELAVVQSGFWAQKSRSVAYED